MGPIPEKAPEAPALRVVKGGAVTVDLETPIEAHGEEVTALTFRPLKVSDMESVGYPVKLGSDGTLEPIPARVSALISRLAGIPASSVAQLSVADWHRAMEAVVGFFGPSARSS
jgi:Phage tail assembly chaperone proteins, E, or 41 or 14